MRRGLLLLVFIFILCSFSVLGGNLTFNGTIPNINLKLGLNTNVADLSKYFNGTNLEYKYKDGVDGIIGLNVTVKSDGKVDMDASTKDTKSIIFLADDDIDVVQSNDVKIYVTGEIEPEISFSPNTNALNLTEGEKQVFAVNAEGNVSWYVDNVLINHTENIYEFTGEDVKIYSVKVIANGEEKTWSVSVLAKEIVQTPPAVEEVPAEEGPVCGNAIREAGENCSNCPSDVSCSVNTQCINGTCVPIQKSNSRLILYIVSLGGSIILIVLGVVLFRKKGINFNKINIFKKKEKITIEPVKTEEIKISSDEDIKLLVDYFKSNLGVFSKEELVKQSLGQGWTQEQIDRALAKLSEGNGNTGENKGIDMGKQ